MVDVADEVRRYRLIDRRCPLRSPFARRSSRRCSCRTCPNSKSLFVPGKSSLTIAPLSFTPVLRHDALSPIARRRKDVERQLERAVRQIVVVAVVHVDPEDRVIVGRADIRASLSLRLIACHDGPAPCQPVLKAAYCCGVWQVMPPSGFPFGPKPLSSAECVGALERALGHARERGYCVGL